MNITVRVIRVYEVPVVAEYGDTEADLEARGAAAINSTSEYTETAVVLPHSG